MKINRKCDKGFTLIELLIVIAIIGIVMAVGIPSYNSYMLKTKRVDGVSFLTEVAGEQVRFFSEYNRYTDSMADLGYGNDATERSNEGYYTLSIATTNNDSRYTLTATPVVGGPQANDNDCKVLSVTSSGVKAITGTSTVDNCW